MRMTHRARVAAIGSAIAAPLALLSVSVHAAADAQLLNAATTTAQTVSDNVLGAAVYVVPIIAVLLGLGIVIRWVMGLLRRSTGR